MSANNDSEQSSQVRSSQLARTAAPRRRRRPTSLSIGGRISLGYYIAAAAATFIVLLLAWWGAAAAEVAPRLFLPSPLDVATRLIGLASSGVLWQDVAISMYRIAVGFLLATVIALPLGIVVGTYRLAEAAIEPLVDFIRYMPVVGFVPLTIIWIGIDDSQKFAIIFVGTFFQQVLLVMDNVKRVSLDLVNIGCTLGLKDPAILRTIVLPSAAPGIWDTMRITLGWAWTWIVLAELVAAGSGLGYRITTAQRYFQTDTIIGYLLLLGLLGLVTDQSMKLVGRVLFPWDER